MTTYGDDGALYLQQSSALKVMPVRGRLLLCIVQQCTDGQTDAAAYEITDSDDARDLAAYIRGWADGDLEQEADE